MKDIIVSIVSHGHGTLVSRLLEDLGRCGPGLSVLLTLNIPETPAFGAGDFPFPLEILHNREPRGFGANHNAAFARAAAPYFCVLNPDVRMAADPFPALLECLAGPAVGVAGPLVRTPEGIVENSARRFPTPMRILKKALGGSDRDYETGTLPLTPDWIAGMFMLFPSEAFRRVRGFDTGYYLYYEDADICRRLRALGLGTVLDPRAEIVHAAQRDSHRRLRYLGWHARSMLRFFTRPKSSSELR